jgi:hypothetical protein
MQSAVQGAIDALYELYAAIDAGDVAGAVGAFADGGIYETTMGTSRGRDEIRAFFDGRINQPGRRALHVVANAHGRQIDDGSVEVHAVLLLYLPDPDNHPTWRLERVVPTLHRLRHLDTRWAVVERSNRTA